MILAVKTFDQVGFILVMPNEARETTSEHIHLRRRAEVRSLQPPRQLQRAAGPALLAEHAVQNHLHRQSAVLR
jgi:hypothetical protein